MKFIIKEDLEAFSADQKANPLGIHLLNFYYKETPSETTSENKMEYPVFNLSHVQDISIIMKCAYAEGLEKYGMIACTGKRHYTPILVDKDRVYIFESLGVSRTGKSCCAQIALAVKDSKVEVGRVIIFENQRQFDPVSCGTDSLIVLKQAFRMQDFLQGYTDDEWSSPITLNNSMIIDKYENVEPSSSKEVSVCIVKNLPPQIAKYTQSLRAIEEYELKNVTIYSSRPGKHGRETVKNYAKRNEGELNSSKSEEQSKGKLVNNAVSNRRKKHVNIANSMIHQSNVEQLKEMVRESSGLNLLLRHIDMLPSAQRDKLIENWIEGEMIAKRDKSGVMSNVEPLSSLSMKLLSEPGEYSPPKQKR